MSKSARKQGERRKRKMKTEKKIEWADESKNEANAEVNSPR